MKIVPVGMESVGEGEGEWEAVRLGVRHSAGRYGKRSTLGGTLSGS